MAAVVLLSGFAFRPPCAGQPSVGERGFKPIFNGKNLKAWEGDTKLWLVENGEIVGRSPGIKQNEFLVFTTPYGDFELRLEFWLKGGSGNSGIQFRSKRIPNHVSGYQADIGERYWGCLYDEARRNKVLVQAPPALDAVLKKDGWNNYVIRAEGERVQLWLNGLQTADYRETDAAIERSGILALQIHSGPPMEVRFRNLRIRQLRSK
jgi:hypothetical protein